MVLGENLCVGGRGGKNFVLCAPAGRSVVYRHEDETFMSPATQTALNCQDFVSDRCLRVRWEIEWAKRGARPWGSLAPLLNPSSGIHGHEHRPWGQESWKSRKLQLRKGTEASQSSCRSAVTKAASCASPVVIRLHPNVHSNDHGRCSRRQLLIDQQPSIRFGRRNST